jgi:hypothetical protein
MEQQAQFNSLPQGSQPQNAPAPQKNSGCIKWLLIGCGALIVLGILGSIAFYFGAKYLFKYGGEKIYEAVEQKIMNEIPADSPSHDKMKAGLRNGFLGLKQGNLSTKEIEIIGDMFTQSQSDGKIEPEEIDRITEYIDLAAKDKQDAPAP